MSSVRLTDTKFAPATRLALSVVQKQAIYLKQLSFLDPLLNAMPVAVIVLNKQRQIVYANQEFNRFLSAVDVDVLIGQRPGEALSCVHANDMPAGCGTSEFCQGCGAVKAILKGQEGRPDVRECHIATERDGEPGALDLRVCVTPFDFDGESFLVMAADNIGDEKRRRILERLFFHDIANTAGAITGLAEIVESTTDPEKRDQYRFAVQLARASRKLTNEIEAQRQLLAAERGELYVQPEPIATVPFMASISELFGEHQVAHKRHIQIDPTAENFIVWTDHALLGRVLGNMLKNALEASSPGETITLGCSQMFEYVRFWVHNPNPMPRKVQLQVFKRSFSTKGETRGLGTYSMKLISEAYLQGRVSFESSVEEGTTFMVMYPIEWVDLKERQLSVPANSHANGHSHGASTDAD